MRFFLFTLATVFFILGCSNRRPLQKVLKSQPILREVARNKKQYHAQIIYTQINRDKKGALHFKNYRYHVDTSSYFYPASTVKLIVSALAIEKLLEDSSVLLTTATPLKAFANGTCQSDEWVDSTAKINTPTIGHYIRKMLLVSDNEAYNRVFDFLGQDYIQQRCIALGFQEARIIQRFDPLCNAAANRVHNRFEFYNTDSSLLYSNTALTTSIYNNPIKNASVGDSYYLGDSLIRSPKSFRYNNNLPLETTHQCLMRLIFPSSFPDSLQFKLPPPEYHFVKSLLGMYPFESDFPKYDSSYFPAYKKYLFYGKDRSALLDSDLRIYNAVGQAYGFTTDVAYFEDSLSKISFFLSATIYTNADGILNDNKYEYETIALPFMKALGQEIYQYERKRKRVDR